MTVIDLRSDTVTKPSAAMRTAMANAEVGDDVYGEDPTVNRLQERAAEVFEREAALFVPTGSMGNTIAIKLHTRSNQEILCETRSHIVEWELGMMAAFAGCIPHTVAAPRGILTWAMLEPHISSPIYYKAQTGLISLENSHNMHGGTVTPLANMEAIWAGAKRRGLPTHLDGARVFNAAVALDMPVARLTSGFDTINFCLSKGLGAPVGSMLVGSKAAIDEARSIRKALGGGMRQAGILAAAGLMALEEGPKRLHEDHANARLLAEAVAAVSGVELDMSTVETNIVIFTLTDGGAAEFVTALKQRGVIASAIGTHQVRFVTHGDVSRADCEQAAKIAADVLAGRLAAA